jgi:hypothetical protein
VRDDNAKLENDPRWIYNDFEKGFAEGKRTGKPVLVVLRFVPCLALCGDRRQGPARGQGTDSAARPVCLRARDQRQCVGSLKVLIRF